LFVPHGRESYVVKKMIIVAAPYDTLV